MAKKTKAELKEQVTAAKEELKIAKTEKRDFEKAHKLPKDTDHAGDEKHGKKWSKFNAMVEKKQKAVDDLQSAYGDAKTEKKVRVSQYDYPLVDGKEMTAGEKKKFRATSRAAAKKAEKDAAKGEVKGAKKSKEEAPQKKSGKKNKNKEVPATPAEEDED